MFRINNNSYKCHTHDIKKLKPQKLTRHCLSPVYGYFASIPLLNTVHNYGDWEDLLGKNTAILV